jgi:hypothetical protein
MLNIHHVYLKVDNYLIFVLNVFENLKSKKTI